MWQRGKAPWSWVLCCVERGANSLEASGKIFDEWMCGLSTTT